MMKYLSECAKAGQNTASDPGGVFALWWRKDLDSHVFHREPLNLGEQPVSDSFGTRTAARAHDVSPERAE